MSDTENTKETPEAAITPTPVPTTTPTPEPSSSTSSTVETPVEVMAPVENPEAEKIHEEQEAAAKQQAQEEALPAEVITIPELRSGLTVRVHQKIKEGEKERVQIFQGIITALRGKTPITKTITVEKTSFGVIVEKIFPLASPMIEKIEVVKKAAVRRSKLYFLREYSKRLKETMVKS